MPKKVRGPRTSKTNAQRAQEVGMRRPRIRSAREAKAYIAEAMELLRLGEISASHATSMASVAKAFIELHLAEKLMEANGISLESVMEGTGMGFKRPSTRRVTRKVGFNGQGSFEETNATEETVVPEDDAIEVRALEDGEGSGGDSGADAIE